jgi:hypothetical protein
VASGGDPSSDTYFHAEDWGDMFLRNGGWICTDYIALCPRTQHSSVTIMYLWLWCKVVENFSVDVSKEPAATIFMVDGWAKWGRWHMLNPPPFSIQFSLTFYHSRKSFYKEYFPLARSHPQTSVFPKRRLKKCGLWVKSRKCYRLLMCQNYESLDLHASRV